MRIGNIEEINLGFTYKPEYVEQGVHFLSVKDISEGKIDFSHTKKVSIETYQNAAYGSKPRKGDILFGRVGTIGKPQIVTTDEPFCIFVSLGFFRDWTNILNKKYICNWMDTNLFTQQVRNNVKGAVLQNLNTGWLKDFLIPLPPLSEQKRIVSEIERIFEQIEVVKENQEELSKLKDGLKNKILDLAIQGKLVKQDPNDEPASELLKKIKAEKAELVKQGKIKKDKQESYIFKGDDNRHYEQIGSETKDITEEIPFEIPNNWCWCRLGNVFDVRDGTHDTPKYYPQGIPLVTSKNLCNGEISYDNVKFISQDDANRINERSFVDNGDILFGMIGTIGKPVIVNKTIEFCIKNVALIKNIFNQDIKYCYYLLLAMEEFMNKNASGGVQPFVSLNYIRNLLIPLPPIKEQERIAYKLNIILDIIMSL